MALLAAMTAAAAIGLVAWGPVRLSATAHEYAAAQTLWGLPGGANAIACLPMLLAAAWGWWAERRRGAPAHLRRPWLGMYTCAALGAIVAAGYHVWPSDALYLASHTAMAAAFTLLCAAMLAERVQVAFGSRAGVAASLVVAATALGSSLHDGGAADLRPLILLELAPLLLVAAGVPGLPGTHTRRSDWLIMLALYGTGRLFDWADQPILEATGLLSGHTLMHLALAAAVAWAAYSAAARTAASATDAGDASQRSTSLNTAG